MSVEIGCVGIDKTLTSLGVDEDVSVGVVDVIGQRFSGIPIELRWLLLGHDLDGDSEELPERVKIRRRARQQRPVGAELLGVGPEPGRRVAHGIDRDFHEDHLLAQPRRPDLALQRDERAGDERALVLAEREEVGEHDVLPPVGGERCCSPVGADQWNGGNRTVDDDTLAGRWGCGNSTSTRRKRETCAEQDSRTSQHPPATEHSGHRTTTTRRGTKRLPGGTHAVRSLTPDGLPTMQRPTSSTRRGMPTSRWHNRSRSSRTAS